MDKEEILHPSDSDLYAATLTCYMRQCLGGRSEGRGGEAVDVGESARARG